MHRRLAALLCGGLIASGAFAGEVASGDWAWNVDDPETHWAATGNDAGQMLGQFCYPEKGSCLYAVGFDTTCDEGDSYPALVNSDAGTANITLKCGGDLEDGANLMLVEDFDQLDALIRKSKRIGFALPMQGDEFKAVRFSLRGSVPALDAMRKFAEHGRSRNPDVKQARDSEVF